MLGLVQDWEMGNTRRNERKALMKTLGIKSRERNEPGQLPAAPAATAAPSTEQAPEAAALSSASADSMPQRLPRLLWELMTVWLDDYSRKECLKRWNLSRPRQEFTALLERLWAAGGPARSIFQQLLQRLLPGAPVSLEFCMANSVVLYQGV